MSEEQTTDINTDSSELIRNKHTQKQKQFARFTFHSLKADREGQDGAGLD